MLLLVDRTAIDREKKTHASNLEQRQILEKNITIVGREIEKVHAEYVNADKRARVAAAAANPSNDLLLFSANCQEIDLNILRSILDFFYYFHLDPTYNGNYGNIDDAKHGGSSHPDRYSMPQVCLFPIFSLDSGSISMEMVDAMRFK